MGVLGDNVASSLLAGFDFQVIFVPGFVPDVRFSSLQSPQMLDTNPSACWHTTLAGEGWGSNSTCQVSKLLGGLRKAGDGGRIEG